MKAKLVIEPSFIALNVAFLVILVVGEPSCVLEDVDEDNVSGMRFSCQSSVPETARFYLDGRTERLIDAQCQLEDESVAASNRTFLRCDRYKAGAYICQCEKHGKRSDAINKPALDQDPNLQETERGLSQSPNGSADDENGAERSQRDEVAAAGVAGAMSSLVIVVAAIFAALLLIVPIVWIIMRRKYRQYEAPVTGKQRPLKISGTTSGL